MPAHRPATPLPAFRRLRWIVGALACGAALDASALPRPRLTEAPPFVSLRPAQPRADYLLVTGPAPLRVNAPPVRRTPVTAAPVVLYAPPAPPAVTTAPAAAAAPAATPTPPADTPAPDGKPPAVRPEDLLPFFDPANSGSSAAARSADGLLFLPARPELPKSSADFRQK